MSRSAYGWGQCSLCGKALKVAGIGVASHLRKHVREGTLEEVPRKFDEPVTFRVVATGKTLSAYQLLR